MEQTLDFHETLMDNLSIGVLVLDEDGLVAAINKQAQKILHVTEIEALGFPLEEIPGLNHQFAETFQVLFSGNKDSLIEFPLSDDEIQRTYQVKLNWLKNRTGKFSGYLLLLEDVSTKNQLEERLAFAQANLDFIIDGLQDYYFETDLKGVVTNINEAFCSHLGYQEKSEIIGKHFRHFTDLETARSVYKNFVHLYETKQSVKLFQYKYRTRDGNSHIGEATITPIFKGDQLIGARGLLRDITYRIESEELLRKTKAEAETRAEELAAINRIASICSKSLNMESVLNELCIELVKIFPVKSAGIGLFNEKGYPTKYLAYHSEDPSKNGYQQKPTQRNSDIFPSATVVGYHESAVRDSVMLLPEYSHSKPGSQGVYPVPLVVRGESIGIIELVFRDPGHLLVEKERRLAEIIASQVATSIENAMLYSKTEKALDIAERDLEIGRQIQSGFFPETIPNLAGYEIASYFEGARHVSGDFYDVFQIDNSQLTALVIGDVCDKGVGAALFMVLIRSLLRSFSVRLDTRRVEESLKNILINTNNYIAQVHGNANMFVTLFFAFLDPQRGELYYVNAGHEPPAILDSFGRISSRLKPTGPAVGLYEDADFKIKKIKLNEGDFLVAFTDGTIDAQNEEGISFSEPRLMNYIQVPWTSLFSMVYEVKTELQKFMLGQRQFDDIALLAIRRKLTGKKEVHSICRAVVPGSKEELLDFINAVLTQYALDPKDAEGIRKISTSLLHYILEHGFKELEAGLISLTFEHEVDAIKLVLRDNGNYLQFSPQESHLVDEVEYDQMPGGGNQIQIIKSLKQATDRIDVVQWKFESGD